VLLQISLTFKCNLNCSYCAQTFHLGHRPKVKETGFIGWVKFFKRFPYKIKEVYVSGGEPTLHRDFARIVRYLLSQGYYVKVFSNLMNIDEFYNIPKCYRFRIQATYHHKDCVYTFDRNYRLLTRNLGHIVYVNEIESPQIFKYSKLQRLLDNSNTYENGRNDYDQSCLRISPDLRINLNCHDLLS
jgi:organic radical activating enzyme